MKKTMLIAAFAAMTLASCGGDAKTDVKEKGLAADKGIWLVPLEGDFAYFTVSDSVVSYIEDGMDAFEFSGMYKEDGDNGVISFEGSDIKGKLTFNPADGSMTVMIPGFMEDGSDFKFTATKPYKALLVYSIFQDDEDRKVYTDATFTTPVKTVALGEVLTMTDFSDDWYEVAGPDGLAGYVKRSSFVPTYDTILDQWLENTYEAVDEPVIEAFDITRKGDVYGAVYTTRFTDGRAANDRFIAGHAEGNRIIFDKTTTDFSAFDALDTDAFEALDQPVTVTLVQYYMEPSVIKDGKVFSPAGY